MDHKELANRFTFHAPKNSSQIRHYEKIRQEGHFFALNIDALCPDSKEKYLAIIKIEEAVFHANAAIARRE